MGLLNDVGMALDPLHMFIPRERDPSEYPSAPPQEKELYQTATQQRGQAALFEPTVKQRLAELADPSKRIAQAYGRANADAAAQTRPLGAMTPFQRAMSKSSALSKIGLMGENQLLQQNLRDRVGMVRFGGGLLTGNVRDLSQMSANQAESDASKMRSAQILEASRANMIGAIAGGIAGKFANRQQSTPNYQNGGYYSDTPSSVGTGTADWYNA